MLVESSIWQFIDVACKYKVSCVTAFSPQGHDLGMGKMQPTDSWVYAQVLSSQKMCKTLVVTGWKKYVKLLFEATIKYKPLLWILNTTRHRRTANVFFFWRDEICRLPVTGISKHARSVPSFYEVRSFVRCCAVVNTCLNI